MVRIELLRDNGIVILTRLAGGGTLNASTLVM